VSYRVIARASLAITALLTSAAGAGAAPAAPPPSDGSSGSFDAQFGQGDYLDWFDVDTGQVHSSASGGFIAFTVPSKTVKYNGQTVHMYNFTDLNMEPSVGLTIYGATPAIFTAKGNITIAGQFRFQNGAINGGVPSSGNNGDFDGGAGSGQGGGGGGIGQGGETSACVSTVFTGSGGGGGGNYSPGQPGLHNYVPTDASGLHYPGGRAGKKENSLSLQGGGGGAAPGGGNSNGEYWSGAYGGNGGGAVVFSTPGTLTITSSGLINAAGSPGTVPDAGNPGSSGGGAGGDTWFFSKTSIANAGQILVNGAAGGKTKVNASVCGPADPINGPNGGDGSGGVLVLFAPAISNSGTINVAGGNGKATPIGGLLNTGGTTISNTGTIIGAN
jgi:hypothetical protein